MSSSGRALHIITEKEEEQTESATVASLVQRLISRFAVLPSSFLFFCLVVFFQRENVTVSAERYIPWAS